jgi:hypothetical protein
MGKVDRKSEAIKLLSEKGYLVHLEQEEYGRYWYVPSRSVLREGVEYRIPYAGDSCTCPDNEYRGATCAHMIVVAIIKIERARWEEAKREREQERIR